MAAGKFDSLDTAAMPFVTVGDDDKFEVNPEAVRYLKTLTGKVAVVSIAGKDWRPACREFLWCSPYPLSS
jgi:hypothetical protein